VSDISRQYASGKEPGLVSGTAASNTAGAGLPGKGGLELSTVKNADSGHDYKDDRTR